MSRTTLLKTAAWICWAWLSPSCSKDKATACPNPANYAPQISATNFPNSTRIDNRYFPLVPGTVFNYRDVDGNTTATAVTSDTKMILGIACVVVHDVVRTPAGDLMEDTFDWYTQDKDGTVWYFGEDTKAYQAGRVVSTTGSWLAGVSSAQPGIIMEGSPKLGDSYRQEYLCGVAEDKADVVSLNESVTVPYGTFSGCLMTKDYSDLEPGKAEHKYYCPGIGEVSAVDIVTVGSGKREDLISVTGPAGGDGGVGP